MQQKEITVHCGAGDGRSGTAMASLKLREIIEQEAFKDPNILLKKENRTDRILLKYSGKSVYCTSMVKRAVEKTREERITIKSEQAGTLSVETENDIKTLIQYEYYVKKQLVLQKEYLKTFSKQLELIKNKAEELDAKGFLTAGLIARNIYDSLTVQKNNFASYKMSAKEFVRNCSPLIENAKTSELSQHRELGLLLRFFYKIFAIQTNSVKKLNNLQKSLGFFDINRADSLSAVSGYGPSKMNQK